MVSSRAVALLVVIFVALAVAPLPLPTNPPPPIAVAVLPRLALAPSDIRVTLTVPPHADNRGVDLLLTDGLARRRSWVPLDAEYAATTTTLWWKDMPEGAYEVIATLIGTLGERGAASVTVTLLAPPQESTP